MPKRKAQVISLQNARNGRLPRAARSRIAAAASSLDHVPGASLARPARSSVASLAGDSADSTPAIEERYLKHVRTVESMPVGHSLRAYHVAAARGLYAMLTTRALAGDLNVDVIGGPHWLTYSDEQVQHA